MKMRKLGQFYFGRHYNNWGIWQVDWIGENGSYSGKHIKDVNSYEAALREIHLLNGWQEPRYIRPCA